MFFLEALKGQQCVKANGPCSEVVFSSPPMESSTPGSLDAGEELAVIAFDDIHAICNFIQHLTSWIFMDPWTHNGWSHGATPRFRAEKLFPGPHLFAGAAIVVIWAVSAAMVPFMEKGWPGGRHCDHQQP